jgi:sulfate permease, SulP family
VLRMKRVRNPDAVALTLLGDFVERVEARGVRVLMGGVRQHLFHALERSGLAARRTDRIFLEQPVRQTSTLLALRRAYELIGEARCATCPRRGPGSRGADALHYEI